MNKYPYAQGHQDSGDSYSKVDIYLSKSIIELIGQSLRLDDH